MRSHAFGIWGNGFLLPLTSSCLPFCLSDVANNATKKNFRSAENSEMAHCSRRTCLLINELLNSQFCNPVAPKQWFLWVCPWAWRTTLHRTFFWIPNSKLNTIGDSYFTITELRIVNIKTLVIYTMNVLRKKDLTFIQILPAFYKIFKVEKGNFLAKTYSATTKSSSPIFSS